MNSLLIVLDSKKSLILSFLGILICLTGFFLLEKRLGTQILDVLPSYDLDLIQRSFLIYGENGRVLYAWTSLTLDLLFPISYVTFSIGLILFLVGNSFFRWLVILPCLVGMVDLIENIQISMMLNQYPDLSAVQVEFANNTTMLKHFLAKVLYSSILFLAILKLGKKVLNSI
tara:strand:+ start:54 stop:569 length:516 start_codon:yes stop_codon:yes gene_type:complete